MVHLNQPPLRHLLSATERLKWYRHCEFESMYDQRDRLYERHCSGRSIKVLPGWSCPPAALPRTCRVFSLFTPTQRPNPPYPLDKLLLLPLHHVDRQVLG